MRYVVLTALLLASSAALAQDQGVQTGPMIRDLFKCQDANGQPCPTRTIARPRFSPQVAYPSDSYGSYDPGSYAIFNSTNTASQCARKGRKFTLTVEDTDDGFSVSCKVEKTDK